MKLNGSNFGPSVAARVLAAIGYLLTASASLGEALSFRWRTEVSSAAPYEAQAMQGESFALEATLVQYGAPLTGEATATFYYQTKQMAASEWFSAPAAWDAATATASVTWSPALDVGQSAYRWFFGIDTAQGHNYRAYGTLRLKPSPGFSPALLEPIDLRAQLKAELYAQLQADLSAAFAAELQAEAQAREAADGAITEAVNSQAGVLEQHQGYLAALSGNFNSLYNSYTNTVSTLQADLATKADQAHTHAIADTTGLQAALDAKADESAVLLADPLIVPPPTGTDRANFFGWVGTLADWGLSGDALDLRVVTLTRRNNAGGVTNATFYARIVHVGDSGEIEVLFQSIGAIDWSTIAYNASCSFSLAHLPGAPYPSATERIALYFVTDPASPAWKSVGTFGLKTQLNASGGIANEPTSQTTLPGGQAFRPILGWAYTDLAATLEGQLALLDNTKAEATHTHEMGEVDGLETALASKAALSHTHSQYLTSFTETDPTISAWAKASAKPTYNWTEILNRPTTWDWANLTNKPTTFQPATHTHAINEVTNLQVALDAKAAATHTHAIADTTGLQAALEALAPLSSVTCTTNDVTYIWQWDEEVGTFALVERE